jgi:hypothetical protein
MHDIRVDGHCNKVLKGEGGALKIILLLSEA